ncbi:MAG: PIG-L family deacetylase, partial [Patescibacteria group bacterium]
TDVILKSAMQNLNLKKNARALVIVAHPDDETIWLGGVILKNPQVRWTVFSLCRASDPDRAPKFFRVCKFLKAAGIIADLEDEGRLGLKKSIPEIKKILRRDLPTKKFHYIFTHGSNGEYGHPRHKSVHLAVKELITEKKIYAEQIFYFNYEPIGEHQLAPKPDSDFIVKLTAAEFKRKRKIMTDLYGFAPDGIDTGYCTNLEALKISNFQFSISKQ